MVSGSSPTHWANVLETDRAPREPPAQHVEDGAIDLVEAQLVDPEHVESLDGGRRGDRALGPHLDEVPYPAQQPVGDPGCAPGPLGDPARPLGVDGDTEDAGRPGDDGLELVHVVEVEPAHEPEPVAKRPCHQAGAGGGAHQGEAGKVEADAPGRGSLADQDVQLEVLHGRVEDLFHRPVQTVDLVDEQDIAVLEVGEQGGQVAGPHQHRPGGDPQSGPHFGGHDAGQGGLAQARRTGEQQMVGRLIALQGGLDDDLQVLGQLTLAHELGQRAGPQAGLFDLVGGHRPRIDRSGSGRRWPQIRRPGRRSRRQPTRPTGPHVLPRGVIGYGPARGGPSSPSLPPQPSRPPPSRAIRISSGP